MEKNSKTIYLASAINKNLINGKLVKIFIFIITLISIAEFILFGMGLKEMNGVDENNIWLGYIALSISLSAGVLGFIGFSKSVTRSKNFFWWVFFSQLMYLISSFIFNLWFSVIKLSIVLGIRFYQKKQWKDNIGKDKIVRVRAMNWKNLIMLIILIFGLGALLGWGMSYVTGDWEASSPYIDGITFLTGIAASLLIARRYRDGYIFGLIGNVLLFVVYIMIGQYTLAVSNVLYLTLIYTGIVSWTQSVRKEKEAL